MPKYEITVDGSNFLVQFHATHRRTKHGFRTKLRNASQIERSSCESVVAFVEFDAG